MFGETLRYWLKNDEADFSTILSKFIQRLIARGYSLSDVSPTLLQAAAMIEDRNTRGTQHSTPTTSDNTLFFHQEFHPMGIRNRTLQNIYKTALSNHDGFEKMIVATSRPKYLRDLLCKTKPPTDTKNYNVSNLLTNLQNSNNP
jgi:hypothetical protein